MNDNFEICIFILYNRENVYKTQNNLDSGIFVCKISQCKSFKKRILILKSYNSNFNFLEHSRWINMFVTKSCLFDWE